MCEYNRWQTVAEIAPSLLLVDIVRKCGRRDCFGEAEVEAGPGRARLLSRPGLDDGSSARSRNTDHPRRGGCEENISSGCSRRDEPLTFGFTLISVDKYDGPDIAPYVQT